MTGGKWHIHKYMNNQGSKLFHSKVSSGFLRGGRTIGFMLYKVFLIKAPTRPTNVQSLAKDYRSFGVVWMSREQIEIFMAISRFYIQINNNGTVFNTKFNVKKCNAFFAWLICKLDISKEYIHTTQKCLKFLLTMCPDKKKVSLIYLNHTKGCNYWVSRKTVSILSINKHT